jgi:transcriptional regulator with XRE-family HTH domain
LAQKPIDEMVGARLAAVRAAQNVSVAQLASALRTTEDQIERYEMGTERISAALLIEICKFFQVKLEDIFPTPDPDHDAKSN